MLNDVRIKLKDGGLGISSDAGTGIHIKIGVASTTNKNKLLAVTGKDDAYEKLGDGPLVDAVLDSLQAGSNIVYCIATAGAVVGTKTAITKTGTGLATGAVNGNPNNSYDVVLQIVQGGAFNAATYIYSLNGGETYTKEKTIPTDGTVNLERTGLSVKFTAGATPNDSFKVGDSFVFQTTAPKMSNAEVLAAVAIAKKTIIEYEYIHVVGGSDETLWAALAAEADTMFNNLFTPIYFLCEARDINTGEDIATYVAALLTARKVVSSYRIQVAITRAKLSALDGKIRESNGAGIVAGTYSKAKVSQSVGEVASFPLNGVLQLLPDGIEDYTDALDAAGFVTFRQYRGFNGFYVTNARMFADSSSDYQYAEIVRTVNKACREVRKQALLYEHAAGDPESIENFKEFLQIPLDKMADVTTKEIYSGEVVIPDGQDVLSTSSLKAIINIAPIPIMRNINVEMGLVNPFTK